MSEAIISVYSRLLQTDISSIIKLGIENPIPHFPQLLIEKVIQEFVGISKQESPVIYTSNNVVIVGDTHGNIHDLLRIIKMNGLPPFAHYVFLGDYVDRGSFSIECITLLFALKVCFSKCVTLLRGNHELKEINDKYGFKSEIISEYENDDLFNKFNDAFAYLPIISIINNLYFCVHGGLSPSFNDIEQIKTLEYPIKTTPPIVQDLLWSDPSDNIDSYQKNNRGVGFIWGSCITKDFILLTKYKSIIRGHQCCSNGVKTNHDDKVVTVFSSSNYSPEGNKCGYLKIDSNDNLIHHELCEISPSTRAVSTFATYQVGKIGPFKPFGVPLAKPIVTIEKRNSIAALGLLDPNQEHRHSRIRIRIHTPTPQLGCKHPLRISSHNSLSAFV